MLSVLAELTFNPTSWTWENFKQALWETLTGILQWFVKHLAEWGRQIIVDGLNGISFEILSAEKKAMLVAYSERINYFFPLYELVAFITWLMGLYSAVLAIRWVLRWIPGFGR